MTAALQAENNPGHGPLPSSAARLWGRVYGVYIAAITGKFCKQCLSENQKLARWLALQRLVAQLCFPLEREPPCELLPTEQKFPFGH